MKLFKSKKAVAVGLTAGLALGLSGAAFGVWSTSGNGSGTAQALTAVAVTVNPVTGAADLYPGGPAGALYLTITNNNPYAVTITSVTGGTITSNNPTACPSANVSLTGSPWTTSFVVGANSTSSTDTIPAAVLLSHGAPDGCQGATFNVPVTVSGSQN
jgi:hypothetical protein